MAMNQDLETELKTKTFVPLKIARRVLDLGDRGARRAVERGEIPTMGIGRNIKVPTSFLRQKLQVETA